MKVIPHTRDCCSNWDGECDCAPKTREELQEKIKGLQEAVKAANERAHMFALHCDELTAEVERLKALEPQ